MKNSLDFYWHDRKLLGKSITVFVLLFLATMIYIAVTPSAAEKLAEKEAAEKAERSAKLKAYKDKKFGFTCLTRLDGSHPDVVMFVQNALREPDSFEHIETKMSPVKDGKNQLLMSYRARNGFGGMNVGNVAAVIENQSCAVLDISDIK